MQLCNAHNNAHLLWTEKVVNCVRSCKVYEWTCHHYILKINPSSNVSTLGQLSKYSYIIAWLAAVTDEGEQFCHYALHDSAFSKDLNSLSQFINVYNSCSEVVIL